MGKIKNGKKVRHYTLRTERIYITLYTISIMPSKLVHLRLSKEMMQEIQEACKDFHYQSPADFLRESAREKLRELEKHKVMRKLKVFKGKKQLTESQVSELMEGFEKEERHALSYFS